MTAVDLETWFPGDSEMAARMRALSWVRTPLGEHGQWPESLRLCVSLCLHSHVPTLLWWGPRFVALYNDACIELLGPQKHPALLARPGADAWPEVWDTLGPVLDGLRSGRHTAGDHQLTCFYARTRVREEVHLKFACSPILSADGRQVAGIFSTVSEMTPAVLEQRRLATLRRLGDLHVTPGSVTAVCRQAAAALEANPFDVAFAAVYALQEGDTLRLAAASGLPAEHPLPESVSSATDGVWPLGSVFVRGRPEVLSAEVRGLRLPGGAWPEPAAEVLLLPLQSFGQQRPCGLLVAGVSPRQVLDADYRTFFEMAAEHIGWALARAGASLRSGAVLLIEPDPDERDRLRPLLEHEVDVQTAADAGQGLEIAHRRPPDVAVAELAAVAPDDFAALRAWRADPMLQAVPMVLIADRSGEAALREGVAAGADDQLVKPFSNAELMARVRGYVALSRSRRERSQTALQAAFTEAQRRAREAEEANARLEELQARLGADLDVMNRLHELATRLVATHELPVVLEEILDAAMALHHADFGNIKLYDPVHRTMVIAVQRGFGQPFLAYFGTVHADSDSQCSEALRERTRVVVSDVETDPRFAPHRAMAAACGFRSVMSLPIISRDGEPKGVLSTHFRAPHTPTERELRLTDLYLRLAAELIERSEAEDALREADRRKDEFLATLAHELRNPLAPIRNGLAIARLTGRGNDELLRTVDMMDRQLSHLVHLVDDLLDMGRIRSGKVELRLAPVVLTDAIERSIEASQPLIDERRHRLVVELDSTPLTVRGDLDRLAQVFSNLLANAAKYTPPGGSISVRVGREQRQAVIGVSDTGRGIAASELPGVFDLFTQGRSLAGTVDSGLGIGLALVRALVEMHGGSVSAASPGPGAGSTFTVRLPLLSAAAPAADPAAPAPHEAAGAGRRRILVVDDNEDAAASLARLLTLQGHQVEVAYDGAVAVERARVTRPDVVFLDLRMPKMDGMTAARHLRALPGGQHLRIFAMTGWGQAHDRERTRRAGFDGHLVKPVRSEVLEELLASLEMWERPPVANPNPL